MDKFNLSLGKPKEAQTISEQDMKGGIKRADIKDSAMLSIFDALDDGNGILEEGEMAKVQQALQEAAAIDGDSSNLSKKEAKKWIKKLGLKDVNAAKLFEFLGTIKTLAANIDFTTRNAEQPDEIRIKYKADENGVSRTEVYNEDGSYNRTETSDGKRKSMKDVIQDFASFLRSRPELIKNMQFTNSVNEIFIEMIYQKYNIDDVGYYPKIAAKYKDIYKEEFEAAKQEAIKKCGFEAEYQEYDETKISPAEESSNDSVEGENTDSNSVAKSAGGHTKLDNYVNTRNEADGFIDSVAQGRTGDCWLISGLNALSETQWGRDAIKEAIDIQPNGDIKITLKGAYGKKKQFTVTKQELDRAKDSEKYSSGDIDVLAIELAVEKYRKQFRETLHGGQEEEIFRLITGSRNTQRIESKQGMKNLIQKAKANPEKYAITANFVIRNDQTAHAYNVSRFETSDDGTKYVILTNPWDARTEIKITEEEFLKYAYELQVLANPKGNSMTSEVDSDGEIGSTTSSKKGNDFNVAPAIHAVANTNPQIIKDSIHKDGKGNINVTLKGVDLTYTITPKELAKAKDSGNYTQGDDDVIALEIAMEKYGAEQWGSVGLAESIIYAGTQRAGTTIYGISDQQAIFLLTGQDNMCAVLDGDKYVMKNQHDTGIDLAENVKDLIKPDLLN